MSEEQPVAPEGMRYTKSGALVPVGQPFQPGNKIGRGRAPSLARRIREMVGDDPGRVANILFDILEDPAEKTSDRIAAAKEILDRGWGKAPTYAPIIDDDPLGETEIDAAIRDIAQQLVRRAHPTLDAQVVESGDADR